MDKEEKAEVREERAERRDRQGGRRGWTRYCRCQDAGCVSSRTTGEKYCDDGIRLYFIPLFPPLKLWIFSSLLEPFSFREKLTFLETYAYVETRTGSSPKLFAESIVQISDRIFPPHSFPPPLLLSFPREGILGIRLISRDF